MPFIRYTGGDYVQGFVGSSFSLDFKSQRLMSRSYWGTTNQGYSYWGIVRARPKVNASNYLPGVNPGFSKEGDGVSKAPAKGSGSMPPPGNFFTYWFPPGFPRHSLPWFSRLSHNATLLNFIISNSHETWWEPFTWIINLITGLLTIFSIVKLCFIWTPYKVISNRLSAKWWSSHALLLK